MGRLPLPFFLLPFMLAACAPVPWSTPQFVYLRLGAVSSLVLQSSPEATQPATVFPLVTPSGCSFWALTPAPAGPFVSVEWQCAYGPAVQVVNVGTGRADFLLDDPTLDYRLLAWSADGQSLYLKAGTLSNPQVLRVEAASRQAEVLPISANTYNLSVAPDGGSLLYALTAGIGLGSELWVARPDGTAERRLLADSANVFGLMRFSPDGRQIAYIRLPDNESSFPAGELWLANADGKNARRLAVADAGRGMPPVWSPDGTKIAFIGRARPDDPASANMSIYDVPAARLLSAPFSFDAAPASFDFPPAWSLEGAKVYFTLSSDGKMSIWFYEMSDGKSGKILGNACCAGWMKP